MKKSFAHAQSPVLACVIRERTARDAIAAVKNGVLSGASAFDLHLSALDRNELTADKLQSIFAASEKPMLALHYNQNFDLTPYGDTDEARTEKLLSAVDAGAAGVDMQGYTFEKNRDTKASLKSEWIKGGMSFVSACPAEVTLNPETIEKQTAYIDEVHARGAEVLLSTHTGCFLNCEQAVALVDFLHERKPDIVKLVTGECNTEEELAEFYKTILTLKNRYADMKVHYHANGKFTFLTRVIGPMLGAHIAFCVDRYTSAHNFDQLPLAQTAQLFQLIDRMK